MSQSTRLLRQLHRPSQGAEEEIVQSTMSELIMFLLFFFLILLGAVWAIDPGGDQPGEGSDVGNLASDANGQRHEGSGDVRRVEIADVSVYSFDSGKFDVCDCATASCPTLREPSLDQLDDGREVPEEICLLDALRGPIAAEILANVEAFAETDWPITQIDVIGHTDDEDVESWSSSFDARIRTSIRDQDFGSMSVADNAGLGLARASAVLSVLLAVDEVNDLDLQMRPLSAGQLVALDGSLLLLDDEAEQEDEEGRRRVEIVLRSARNVDTSAPSGE